MTLEQGMQNPNEAINESNQEKNSTISETRESLDLKINEQKSNIEEEATDFRNDHSEFFKKAALDKDANSKTVENASDELKNLDQEAQKVTLDANKQLNEITGTVETSENELDSNAQIEDKPAGGKELSPQALKDLTEGIDDFSKIDRSFSGDLTNTMHSISNIKNNARYIHSGPIDRFINQSDDLKDLFSKVKEFEQSGIDLNKYTENLQQSLTQGDPKNIKKNIAIYSENLFKQKQLFKIIKNNVENIYNSMLRVRNKSSQLYAGGYDRTFEQEYATAQNFTKQFSILNESLGKTSSHYTKQVEFIDQF